MASKSNTTETNKSQKNSSSNKNFNLKSRKYHNNNTSNDKTTMENNRNNNEKPKISDSTSVVDKSIKNTTCSYCSMNFVDLLELRTHCSTESHQAILMSDEGRVWKWRCPPRGYSTESYVSCENFSENGGICGYGNQCVEAHGEEELTEWKERFEYRKVKLEKARDIELYGKSYTEQLLERWTQSDKVMKERVDGVEETCSNEFITTVSSKVSKRDWTFVLKTKRPLKAVALLQDTHRTHFVIKQVYPAEPKLNASGKYDGNKILPAELISDQEWVALNVESNKLIEPVSENMPLLEHRVKIVFSTDIYGTFRQSVVFDFGTEPILVKHLCIDVVPVTEYDKIQEIRNDILSSSKLRWDVSNASIIPYVQAYQVYNPHNTSEEDTIKEAELLERYQCPTAASFILTQSTITEKKLTKNNYRSRMHELLYVEEIARYEQIAQFNLSTNLKVTNNFILAPNGMATSTAKYSHSGELFAILELSQDISEDTSAGRLILNNCSSVFLAVPNGNKKINDKTNVYEALIEDKSKNIIYLKLSADTVKALSLKHEEEVKVDIQFQPNREIYCQWHNAIDKILDLKIIFPDTYINPGIPWNPKRQWDITLDPKLNSKQREAVVTITSPISIILPPILLIGPFGTGKTYTLAQIIKQLLLQSEARILICTHSNSAADLYIREYLHPWVEEGIEEATPLRVYYHKRWVATVNTTVQKYCLIELKGNTRVFKRPTVEDIMRHKIVVVTLSTSTELSSLKLKKGYFTHILLDEAAQAMESEAIMPLALADTNTRIVLAGDHMQMSPEVYSNFARERKLHISLLERLYDFYPANFPTKVLLCENYRAHEAIIKFTSELFYDQKLIASGKQPRHEKFYPLTFFTTRGEDIQDKNSTAFYNNSEVYEIVERVCELRKKWPTLWGKFNEQSIGIMTPYADQVFRIRSELRKRRMAGISVERVLNVQGKQFRAVFLSTVRTRKTCSNKPENSDYGFLSNSKLLNTAITRAQSLVSVVGDPVALCSIGRCRKVWERFIETCHQNKSLFGITWQTLKLQLDGVELRKTYVLNPLAPEFIPRALQTESYLRDQITLNNRKYPSQQQQQQQSTVQNIHHLQQSSSQQLPTMPSHNHTFHMQNHQQQQQSQLLQQNHLQVLGPYQQQSGPPIQTGQGFNNMINQPFRSPSYHHHLLAQTPALQQYQAPNYINSISSTNSTFSNFNQQHMPHSQGHPPPLMQPSQQQQQNFHVTPHLSNASNLWNSTNSLFPSLPAPESKSSLSAVNPWYVKPPLSQQSPHLRPAIQQQPATLRSMSQLQHHNLFTPTNSTVQSTSYMQQQQQQQMNHFQSLPKFPINDSVCKGNELNSVTLNEIMNQPDLMEGIRKSEKDIQFLQNVHFPEKQQLYAMNVLPGGIQNLNTNKTVPFTNVHAVGCSHLLPPNMSFYDLAMEQREIQYRWFSQLMETYGLEEAEKFAEILRQVPIINMNQKSMNSNVNNKNVNSSQYNVDNTMNMYNNTGNNESMKNHIQLMEMQQQQQQQQFQQQAGTINKMEQFMKSDYSKSSSLTSNNMFQTDVDNIFMSSLSTSNQTMKYESEITEQFKQDIDKQMQSKPATLPNSMYQQQQQNVQQMNIPADYNNDRNILNGIDLFNLTNKPIEMEMEGQSQSPHRSVPLYMRQRHHE